MPKKNKTRRSESEEKEYYKGLIRKKDKRIKILEREISRLTKYLARGEVECEWDSEEGRIKSPANHDQWVCERCGSTECDELVLPQKHLVRKYITCKKCGNRSRVEIDGSPMATNGEQKTN